MKIVYSNFQTRKDVVFILTPEGIVSEIATEAGRDDKGRMLSPEVLVLDNLTGTQRMLLSLSEASKLMGCYHNYLSVMFSQAKKAHAGNFVPSLTLKQGRFYVTRLDWARRVYVKDVKPQNR